MATVTVSPKFQVVIPQAIQYQDRIELIPVRPMRKARGMLAGIDTSVPREDDRL